MSRYIMLLEIDDAFYQEFSEQGISKNALLEELKLVIQDQIEEYDLEELMTRMLSTDNKGNTFFLAPKKDWEDELPRFMLVCRDM